jgi:hypothetical protein
MLRCIFLNLAALERFKVSQFVRFPSIVFHAIIPEIEFNSSKVKKFSFRQSAQTQSDR